MVTNLETCRLDCFAPGLLTLPSTSRIRRRSLCRFLKLLVPCSQIWKEKFHGECGGYVDWPWISPNKTWVYLVISNDLQLKYPVGVFPSPATCRSMISMVSKLSNVHCLRKKCKTPKLSKVVTDTLKARKMKSRIPKKSTKAGEMKTKHGVSIPTPLSSLALVFCTSFVLQVDVTSFFCWRASSCAKTAWGRFITNAERVSGFHVSIWESDRL